MPEDLKRRLTSRKFIGTAWLHVMSVVLLFTNVMDTSQWVEFNTFLLGIYVGGNAVSKFGEGAKKYAENGGSGAPYKVDNK